jgi:hypothetical protein
MMIVDANLLLTARVYARLCAQVEVTGNLVPDAQLASLCGYGFHAISRSSLDESHWVRLTTSLNWPGSTGHSASSTCKRLSSE